MISIAPTEVTTYRWFRAAMGMEQSTNQSSTPDGSNTASIPVFPAL